MPKVDLEKLEALVHTFPYPTTELAVCVEKAIAELRAARALIASLDRTILVSGYDAETGCSSCKREDTFKMGEGWTLCHAPDCAWVAYDAATRPPSPHSP